MTAGSGARTPWMVAAVLGVLALFSGRYWAAMPGQPGVDFHQFWGIAKAQRESGHALGSPYRAPDAYQGALVRRAASSGDERLQFVVQLRERPDLTGTPFVYALFGQLPDGYSAALQGFRGAQLAAFMVAVFLLVRPLAASPPAIALALASAAAFDPLLLDLSVGNLSTLQLGGLVVIAVALEAAGRRGATPLVAASAAVALAVLSFIKPIVVPACALLALHLLVHGQPRARIAALGSAVLASGLIYAWPLALFKSPGVWADWSHEALASTDRLSYATGEGNYSAVTLLAELFGQAPASTLGLTVGALLASLLLVARRHRHGTVMGTWAPVLAGVLNEPLALAALGLLALLALSPLVWSHYHVLGVVPALWLCRAEGAWPRTLGWVSLVLLADPLRRVFMLMEGPSLAWHVEHAFAWVPAWVGFLLVLDGRLQRSAAAPRP